MKILAIETSCDETAISIVEADGGLDMPRFTELTRVVSSQIEQHRAYGGVVPNIAKREHQKLLLPVLLEAIATAGIVQEAPPQQIPQSIAELLTREPSLFEEMHAALPKLGKPALDYLAVTTGPGLEPALWVGINFARALATLWNMPAIAANHMEGHIMSPLLRGEHIAFPALALLISGGHTELVRMSAWGAYKLIGVTQDDAVGEAFDKVARILGLPYPGGPEISTLAQHGAVGAVALPRPMLQSGDCNFSFSGLKTAVKYYADDHAPLTAQQKADIALEFERAVTDVLVAKTRRALEETDAATLIVGGGVIANRALRTALADMIARDFPATQLLIPSLAHCGDNASMIAAAAYIRIQAGNADRPLIANGSEVLAMYTQ